MPWPKGRPRSEETKQKIAAWGREHAPFKGRHHTPESKALLSASMSRTLQGNKRRLGIPHNEETKRRMSEASRANWQKDEFRAAARQWWGNLTDEERREQTKQAVDAMASSWQGMDPDAKVSLLALRGARCSETLSRPEIRHRRSLAVSGGKNPMFGRHHSDQAKQRISRPGPLNPRWKGGLSRLPYPIEFGHALKERIRERDGRACQLCGKPEADCGRRLDIHHIDHEKENLDGSNLISLCRGCNSRVNSNREHWQQLFREKITEYAA